MFRTFPQDESKLLKAYGYERNEYFVSGKAGDIDFKTRVVVCKPADAVKYSGTAMIEIYQNSVWAQVREYILRNGHMWVMASCRGGNWLGTIKKFNAARYDSLRLPDEDLSPEVLFQITDSLRRKPEENPAGYRANKVVLAGYSGDAAAVRDFISRYHNRARYSDGRPVFDGYFVCATAVGSAPKPVPDIDLPVIEIMNENEMIRSFWRGAGYLAYRRPDGDQYRLYEIPGAAHISTRRREGVTGSMDLSAIAEIPLSQFPMNHLYSNALHHLFLWINQGIDAPHGDRIKYLLDAKTIARDEHGNALGGVRSTYLDVPFATYVVTSTSKPGVESRIRADMIGHIVPFSREKMDKLYSNKAGYISRVEKKSGELVDQRWYLPEDAEEIKKEAAQFQWPT